MTIFLPDSSVLIDLLRRKPNRIDLVRALLSQGHSLASCAVTVGEIYSGMRSAEASATAELFSTLIWVDITAAVARKAGRLRYTFKQHGMNLTMTDTMIAATALHYGLTLITDNKKDFPMPELNIHPLQ